MLVPAADGAAVAQCQELADRCTQAYAEQHNQTIAACIATQLHNATIAECQSFEYNAQNDAMHSWGMYASRQATRQLLVIADRCSALSHV